jgi:hypothetical protein
LTIFLPSEGWFLTLAEGQLLRKNAAAVGFLLKTAQGRRRAAGQ